MLMKTKKTAPAPRGPEPSPTRGLVRGNQETEGAQDRTAAGSAEAPRGTPRGFWIAMLLAIVTLVAVVTVTVMTDRQPGEQVVSTGTVPAPGVGTQEFLGRLANQGYIPPEAVDRQLLLRERAVERGDVPTATLDAPAGGTPLDGSAGRELER